MILAWLQISDCYPGSSGGVNPKHQLPQRLNQNSTQGIRGDGIAETGSYTLKSAYEIKIALVQRPPIERSVSMTYPIMHSILVNSTGCKRHKSDDRRCERREDFRTMLC